MEVGAEDIPGIFNKLKTCCFRKVKVTLLPQ